MIIIHGSELYGRCDQVVGLFYVVTRFGHLYYLPLLPLRSYLVMEGSETGKAFSGRPIGLCGKSILLAWLRLAMFIAIIVLIVFSFIAVLRGVEGKGTWLDCAGLAAGIVSLVYLFMASYRWARAGPSRALRLATAAGLDPEIVVHYFQLEDFFHPAEGEAQDSSPADDHLLRAEEEYPMSAEQ